MVASWSGEWTLSCISRQLLEIILNLRSVDMDDFSGRCGSGKFPLLTALSTELEGYKVDLEYEGPYEAYKPGGKYTTKDRKSLFLLDFLPALTLCPN